MDVPALTCLHVSYFLRQNLEPINAHMHIYYKEENAKLELAISQVSI